MSAPLTAPKASIVSNSDDWGALGRYTDARIALGRAGTALPTSAQLEFQAAHAIARDAVHTPLDFTALQADIARRGWESALAASAAPDRGAYLKRPDLGRVLSEESLAVLSETAPPADIALVVGDGLSSRAIAENAVAMLDALIPRLKADGHRLSPVILARQSRVALADRVGEIYQASASIILIGERPGLSAADSMGAYLTWMPNRDRVDAERNCISNIRRGGLPPEEAAEQAAALIRFMFRHHMAGVRLNALTERLAAEKAAALSAPISP